MDVVDFWLCTVSGRAWTMNSSPVMPSLAHSMSIGVGCAALARSSGPRSTIAQRARSSTSSSVRHKRGPLVVGGAHVGDPVVLRVVDHAQLLGPDLLADQPAGSRPAGAACERRYPSGMTRPWTTFSPRPHAEVTYTTSRNPESVSSVNMTPRAGQVGPHHALDAGREGDIGLPDVHVLAVADRPCREQAGEAPTDRVEHVGVAVHHRDRSPAGRRTTPRAGPRRWRSTGRRRRRGATPASSESRW